MSVNTKLNKKSSNTKDSAKEAVYKELSSILHNQGIEVRREELRRGPGWKAVSGVCRVRKSPVVIVDRRLPQDEQISFLVERILDLQARISDDKLSRLPEPIAARLSGTVN